MLRRLILLTVMLAAALTTGPAPPARAQGALLARARYALPVYRLPDATSPIVGVLVPQEEVVLEARDAAGAWVLGHSADGSARGWMQAGRLSYEGEAHALSLPIRDEAIFVAAPEDSVPAYPEINLNDYPVIPLSFGQAAALAARGRALRPVRGVHRRAVRGRRPARRVECASGPRSGGLIVPANVCYTGVRVNGFTKFGQTRFMVL